MNLDLIRESVVVDYSTVSGTNAECMHLPVIVKLRKSNLRQLLFQVQSKMILKTLFCCNQTINTSCLLC